MHLYSVKRSGYLVGVGYFGIQRLRTQASETMPELKNYRLFISHAWRYHDGYDRLIKFLNDAPYFKYSNYSVPSAKRFESLGPAQLKEELRDQIRPTQCVVVLGGLYVSYSPWIQFEIDYAKSLGKPIVGVKPWSSQRTPQAVSLAANTLVGWNTDSIVGAIRNYAI